MKKLYDKDGALTEYGVARMLANPFYCLHAIEGGTKPLIKEKTFIDAGVQAIKEKGAEEYIKHILENLKGNFV